MLSLGVDVTAKSNNHQIIVKCRR